MAEPTSAADNQILKPHSNVIVPHKIANHDTEADQLNVWNGTEWVNIYDGNDMRNMNIDLHKVSKVVEKHAAEIPAVESAANSAVEQAESAVSASKVNSEAIAAQSEAVSEAKSAISSATAAIQQTAATAASDAAKIRADVAQVQNEVNTAKAANSASVEALKSDVSAAKQDLADVHDRLDQAQSAIEQNQKLINDSVAKITSDVSATKQDLATAQQNNADLAKQLDDYSKQAEAQGKTIKSIQNDQNGFTATLADVKGNVSQVSDKVDGLSAGLKDAQDNVASIKAQADQLNATLTDHAKSIATLTASAKELSSTLEDADGRLNKVEQTAQTNSSTLSDVQGDLSQVKQQADGLVTTLKDAQGNIDQLQQTAKGTAEQISDVQGDITNLQKDVNGIKLTIADHDKNIHTLQADSKTLKDDMADAKGNISSLQKTATSLDSEFKDHDGRLSKVEQTATKNSADIADAKGNITNLQQTAKGLQTTIANAQGDVNSVKTTAQGLDARLTTQGNDIATIKANANGLSSRLSGVEKSSSELANKLNNLKIGTSNLLHHSDTFEGWHKNTSIEISSEKYVNGTIAILKPNGSGSNSLETGLDGPYDDQPVTWTVYAKADNNGDKLHTELWGGGGFTDQSLTTEWKKYKFSGKRDSRFNRIFFWGCQGNKGNIYLALPFAVVGNTIGTWSPNTDDVADKITTNSTQIVQNKKEIDLKANQDTVDDLTGEVSQTKAQLKVQADQISSKVSSEDFKTLDNKVGGAIAQIDKNTTAIDQTNKQISLKADQTDVDKINGTVNQNSSRLNVMAGEISSKVTATDVNNIVDSKGYATTSTVQSLITQKAGTINESITSLDAKYNATVTQVQSLTASIDGLQSAVANKADSSQVTQLSNLVQSKVSTSDFTSKVSQLSNDINARVAKGDLLSQINIDAGHTLIQSNKIYFDADSFVMSPNSKAFIPSAFITNLSADKITTGTLKSIQIDNGDGKFTVNSNGDVVANSIKLRNGQFLQGTIAGSTIYALNNDEVQDPKLAPKSDWYKITPNMIRWFNHYDQSVGQIGVGQGVITEGASEFNGTPGLTISDSAKILLGTAQRTVVTGDEIGNLETTGLDWMSKTNLEIKADGLQVNLDPDQGNEYDGKGAEFSVQKDNKIGAYFGSGDHGDELSITTAGWITFNAGLFDVNGEVHIPDHGLTVKDLHVTRWLGVDGSKNSIVNTSQGTVAINAYETAEYYFGDIGEGQTNSNGIAYIGIEKLFNETVNTTIPYHVFITAYGPGNIWVDQREHNRFVVKSDQPNLKFSWEIKAKRKGYEHTRLQNVDDELNHMETTS